MSRAALTIVSDSAQPGAAVGASSEPLGDQVRRLQTEAKAIARDHIAALETALAAVARLSHEIADGGDAYPVGAREIARQLIGDVQSRAGTLDAILARAR